DVRTAGSLAEVIDEFDKVVGCDRLGSLHVNDSMTALGSNRDRHANLGEGEIGPDGIAAFLSAPRFEGLPAIFEAPGAAGKGVERERVRRRRRGGARGRGRQRELGGDDGRRARSAPAPIVTGHRPRLGCRAPTPRALCRPYAGRIWVVNPIFGAPGRRTRDAT